MKRTKLPATRLSLSHETLRTIARADLTEIAGGRMPETRWTFCDQVPTQCYKPNPY
ncbi:MAG: hypothetical protein K8W52_03690 [Deltaproteobacteria bacterium]|nr:hypothetical protein [Deltaproteobacteria bacterium]